MVRLEFRYNCLVDLLFLEIRFFWVIISVLHSWHTLLASLNISLSVAQMIQIEIIWVTLTWVGKILIHIVFMIFLWFIVNISMILIWFWERMLLINRFIMPEGFIIVNIGYSFDKFLFLFKSKIETFNPFYATINRSITPNLLRTYNINKLTFRESFRCALISLRWEILFVSFPAHALCIQMDIF